MWVKVDDGFPDHDKVATAGAKLRQASPATGTGRVCAVWLAAMAYCNKHLTDGFVKDVVVHRFHVDSRAIDVMKAMAGRDGLVRRVRGGWQLVNYKEYQPSKAEVREKRQKERDRKRRFRELSARTTENVHADSAPRPAIVRAASDHPDPIRTVPARTLKDQEQREDARSSHSVLVRIAHEVLKQADAQSQPDSELIARMKDLAGSIPYDGTALTKALNSARRAA